MNEGKKTSQTDGACQRTEKNQRVNEGKKRDIKYMQRNKGKKDRKYTQRNDGKKKEYTSKGIVERKRKTHAKEKWKGKR